VIAVLLLSLLSPAAASAQGSLPKDNGKLVFVSFQNSNPATFDFNPEVYTMNADGSGQTRLTNSPGLDFWPAWSSDGTKIVFTSDRDGNGEVYTMNADGSAQTRITADAGGDLDPAFSPDGTKVIFVSDRDGHHQIYAMNADGSGQTNLTRTAANETEPAFSPDGKKIVFESDRDGDPSNENHEIYTMNADGSQQTRLTNTSTGNPTPWEQHPSFSPDGTKIVFDDNFHSPPAVPGFIYVMNADGSGRTRLTSRPDRHGLASFSPDGTKITFTASEDIYIMNPDGSNQTAITSDPFPDIQSNWQPIPRTAAPAPAAGAVGAGPPATAGDRPGAPLVDLSGRETQRVGPVIEVIAQTDEPTELDASGRIGVPRTSPAKLTPSAAQRKAKTYLLPGIRASAPARTEVTLRLQVSRKARTAIKARLKRGRRSTARITVVATDLAGNQRTVFRTVRLKR